MDCALSHNLGLFFKYSWRDTKLRRSPFPRQPACRQRLNILLPVEPPRRPVLRHPANLPLSGPGIQGCPVALPARILAPPLPHHLQNAPQDQPAHRSPDTMLGTAQQPSNAQRRNRRPGGKGLEGGEHPAPGNTLRHGLQVRPWAHRGPMDGVIGPGGISGRGRTPARVFGAFPGIRQRSHGVEGASQAGTPVRLLSPGPQAGQGVINAGVTLVVDRAPQAAGGGTRGIVSSPFRAGCRRQNPAGYVAGLVRSAWPWQKAAGSNTRTSSPWSASIKRTR